MKIVPVAPTISAEQQQALTMDAEAEYIKATPCPDASSFPDESQLASKQAEWKKMKDNKVKLNAKNKVSECTNVFICILKHILLNSLDCCCK